jgi:hypothetical protein
MVKKFAWCPVLVKDTDGQTVLLWLELYHEERVSRFVVRRRYKCGPVESFMSLGW